MLFLKAAVEVCRTVLASGDTEVVRESRPSRRVREQEATKCEVPIRRCLLAKVRLRFRGETQVTASALADFLGSTLEPPPIPLRTARCSHP